MVVVHIFWKPKGFQKIRTATISPPFPYISVKMTIFCFWLKPKPRRRTE